MGRHLGRHGIGDLGEIYPTIIGRISVGRTEVQARIFGDRETRGYTFLIDTGATYLALPPEEIEALGLRQGRMRLRLMSATGVVDVNTYYADGELMGEGFSAILVPASTPLIGYELLENLRFRVNPVSGQIEKVPEDEIHPPYLL